MKKKLIALLLAAVLTAITGCGGQNAASGDAAQAPGDTAAAQTEAGEPTPTDSKEKTTFKIAVLLHPLTKDEDFNNKEVFKQAEEATGVHIEWLPISAADAEDKVNIMLASDLPDAFFGLVGEGQIANNMDSFANLAENDLLKTYAPHVAADYETINGGFDLVTWPDGSIRSLMTGRQTSYENDGEGIMFINKAWLDKAGKEIPTTTEEFLDVLRAFRDGDMNGNGDTTDEIPLEPSQSDWCSKIMNLANPWGIAGTDSSDEAAFKMVKDGKVVGTADTEEFRSFLEFAHQLVEEGLLDMESFSQTSEQYHAKLSEGVAGCYWAWNPYGDQSETAAADYVVVPALQAPDGPGYVKTGSQDKFAANRTGFAITSACKDVPRLLEWWDYLSSSTDMKYTSRFGPKGEAWDMDENGTVFEKLPESLTDDFTIENYKYTYGMVDYGPLIRKDENAEVLEDVAWTSWYRIECVKEVHDYCLPAENQLPIRFVDPAKTNERTFIETELLAYIRNYIATSILEGIDDSSWNAHLEQLKALQYDAWLQWYQDYLDGKF